MYPKLSKYFIYPVLAFHICVFSAFSQSPSSPILLSSPFEPDVRISAGLQRGWGYGSISDLNHWGVNGIVDFTQYKIQINVGITENENFKNTFSFNSGFALSLRKSPYDYIFQPALFSGFGFTKVFTSADKSFDMINIPIGVSLGLDGPIPGIDLNISFSPKLQYRYLKFSDGENVLGAGINIGMLYTPGGKKMGIKVGADFLNIKRNPLMDNELERSLSVGLEYLLY